MACSDRFGQLAALAMPIGQPCVDSVTIIKTLPDHGQSQARGHVRLNLKTRVRDVQRIKNLFATKAVDAAPINLFNHAAQPVNADAVVLDIC